MKEPKKMIYYLSMPWSTAAAYLSTTVRLSMKIFHLFNVIRYSLRYSIVMGGLHVTYDPLIRAISNENRRIYSYISKLNTLIETPSGREAS
jgi:hypothetical protein